MLLGNLIWFRWAGVRIKCGVSVSMISLLLVAWSSFIAFLSRTRFIRLVSNSARGYNLPLMIAFLLLNIFSRKAIAVMLCCGRLSWNIVNDQLWSELTNFSFRKRYAVVFPVYSWYLLLSFISQPPPNQSIRKQSRRKTIQQKFHFYGLHW